MDYKQEDWTNAECEIHIIKIKGRDNTIQQYSGTTTELLVCISSMIEQLLRHGIITLKELFCAVKMPLDKLKNELNNKEED